MKARITTLMVCLWGLGQIVSAQNTVYMMNVKLKDGSIHTIKADEVAEVFFSASQSYDPSNPVTADVQSIHAPQEGGAYTVHINSTIPLTTESSGQSGVTVVDFFYDHFLNQAPVNMTTTYNDGTLSITVRPATSHFVVSKDIKLYDLEGTEVLSITVSQDGNPDAPFISNEGNNYIVSLATMVFNSHQYYRNADVEYTGLLDLDGIKAPLQPDNRQLYLLWSYLWQRTTYNNQLMHYCNNTPNMTVFQPMCYVLNALSYYQLVTLFGGVPYYEDVTVATDPLPRSTPEEIFSILEEQLTSVMGTMEEKVTGCADTPEKMYMLSKDIARVILADIYMYLGRYADAKPLLENIVNSNRYSLVPLIDNLDSECSEVIWSMPDDMPNRARGTVSLYNEDLCIMQTYGDVLLSLAECETMLGNDDKAKIYLNQVITTKGIETTSTETLAAISEVRSMIQIDFGGYFAFLKRTGLAQSTLGLSDYQLLFPIPQEEVMRNPGLTQNPGYE